MSQRFFSAFTRARMDASGVGVWNPAKPTFTVMPFLLRVPKMCIRDRDRIVASAIQRTYSGVLGLDWFCLFPDFYRERCTAASRVSWDSNVPASRIP